MMQCERTLCRYTCKDGERLTYLVRVTFTKKSLTRTSMWTEQHAGTLSQCVSTEHYKSRLSHKQLQESIEQSMYVLVIPGISYGLL